MGNILKNKTFISTRPIHQNEELRSLLVQEGARLIEMPTIAIESASLDSFGQKTLKNIDRYTWIVFTSPNGVRFFFHHLNEIGDNKALPQHIKFAVIGSKTDAILKQYGYQSTLLNPGNTGKELGNELLEMVNENDNLLFPEGNLARRTVCKLIEIKAKCTNLTVYRTVTPKNISEQALDQIRNQQYELIILTSPSGFNNMIRALGQPLSPKTLKLICIGTTTADEVKSKGYIPMLTAEKANAQGIYECIVAHYSKRKMSDV